MNNNRNDHNKTIILCSILFSFLKIVQTLFTCLISHALLTISRQKKGGRGPFNKYTLIDITGENLDAVTAVTDSFKMADTFAGDRSGGAVAQTSARTVDISVRQGRVWVYRL